jgi:hypothetical protein
VDIDEQQAVLSIRRQAEPGSYIDSRIPSLLVSFLRAIRSVYSRHIMQESWPKKIGCS